MRVVMALRMLLQRVRRRIKNVLSRGAIMAHQIDIFGGRSGSRCPYCKRPLTSAKSLSLGVGPVCLRKYEAAPLDGKPAIQARNQLKEVRDDVLH